MESYNRLIDVLRDIAEAPTTVVVGRVFSVTEERLHEHRTTVVTLVDDNGEGWVCCATDDNPYRRHIRAVPMESIVHVEGLRIDGTLEISHFQIKHLPPPTFGTLPPKNTEDDLPW